MTKKCKYTIGDIIYCWDIQTEQFRKLEVETMSVNGAKEIMINGRFDADECFETLKEAYLYECRLATNAYHEDLRNISENYYKLEKELR